MATAGLVSAKAKSVLNSGVIPILPKSLEQQKKKCKDPFTLMALDQAFLGLSLSQGSFDPYIIKT